MTATQNSFLQMAAAVKVTVNAHTALWQHFQPFSQAFADFVSLLNDADAAIAKQSTSSAGSTAGKADRRALLQLKTGQLVDTLRLWATANNNTELLADIHTTPSDMVRMQEKALVGHVTKLLSLARQMPAAQLAQYHHPVSFFEDLQTDLSSFSEAIGTPRHKRSESQEGTRQLADLLQRIDDLLQMRLDPAARLLRNDHPTFYREYDASRGIIDAGSTLRALEVQIIDATTGRPVENVRASIRPGDQLKASTTLGRFYVQHLAPGEYELSLQHPGYQSGTLPFTIVAGQRTKLQVTLRQAAAQPGAV